MVDNTQKPKTVDEWLQLNSDADEAFIAQLRDASRMPGFSLDNVDNDYQAFLKQKETQALQIANGDLSQASFDEIHKAWDVLAWVEEGKSAQNLVDAQRKMLDFAEQKVEESAKHIQDLKDNSDGRALLDMMMYAPELSEWLVVNNKEISHDAVKEGRNQQLRFKLDDWYHKFDDAYELNDLPPAEQINKNAATLDDIEKSFAPFAKDGQGKFVHPEFEQMEAFFDKLEIDNSAQDVDKVNKDDYKAQVIEMSMAVAKTSLSIDKDFANLSKEEQQKRLAQETLDQMESLVLTALVQQKTEDIAASKNTEEAIKQLNEESEEFVNRHPHLKNIAENAKNHSKLRQAVELSYLDTVLKMCGYFNSDLTMAFVGQSFKAYSRNQGVDDKSLDDPHKFFEKSVQDKDFKPVISNRVAVANLAVASSGLELVSKRIAQKTGVDVLWKKAKALDAKLKEAYPKAYPVMKGMVTTLSISTGLGPTGLVVYSGVKTYQAVKKSVDNYRKNRQEGQSYFGYLAKNPREFVGIAQAAVGATLTTLGVGGALFSAENMGLAGHLMNGDMGIGQSLASAGGNLFDNMKNAVTHPVETAKNVGNAALEALKNPQKLARMGVAVGAGLAKSAISLSEALKAKGDERKQLFKKARSEFVAGLAGAGIGLGLSSLMGGVSHGDDANAVDDNSSANDGVHHGKPIGPEDYKDDVNRVPTEEARKAFEEEAMNKAADEAKAVEESFHHEKADGPKEYQDDVDRKPTEEARKVFEKKAMNKAADEAEAQEKATQQQNDQHQPTGKGGANNQHQPTGKGGADNQHQPTGKGGTDNQHQPTGKGGTDNQHQPTGKGGTDSQHQPAGKEGTDNQYQPTGKEGTDSQHQPAGKEGTDNQYQPTGKEDTGNQQPPSAPQPHVIMPTHSQMRELSLDLEKAYDETGNIGQALNKVLHDAPEIGMTEEQAMKASQIMQDSLRSYGIVEGEYSHQDVEKAIDRMQHETAREAALEERDILQQNQSKIDELKDRLATSEQGSGHTSSQARVRQVQNLRGLGDGNGATSTDSKVVHRTLSPEMRTRMQQQNQGNG